MNPTVDGQQWMVLINQDTRRMMSTREVQTEVQAGVLPRETLVWRAGMAAWQSIGSVAELAMSSARPTVPRQMAQTLPAQHMLQAAHAHHGGHSHGGHSHGHAHARPSAPNPALVQEIVSTGAVALIIVLMTTWLLSAGGAFQAGGGPHGGGAAHEASGAEAKTASH